MTNFPSRPCAQCGAPVHPRSKVCKVCGAASPWAAGASGDDTVLVDSALASPASTVVALAKPAIAKAKTDSAYIALAGFHTVVGSNFVAMKKGEAIPHHLIATFIEQGLPIASAESDGVVACPHCQRVFALDAKKLATRRAATAA